MNRAAAQEMVEPSPESEMAFEDWMVPSDDAIQLDCCRAYDWVVVKTSSSVYDLIVLPGGAGEVLVRGGRFLPEFRCARVVGSTDGGTLLKVKSICVGFRLELNVNGDCLVTSRIQAISDHGPTSALASVISGRLA
jgi:hypothetical protein